MKMLSQEELLELRADIASLALPQARERELILLIDSIVTSIIDQQFGWSPVQISLSARASRAFSGADSCARVSESGRLSQVDAEVDSVTKLQQSPDGFTP